VKRENRRILLRVAGGIFYAILLLFCLVRIFPFSFSWPVKSWPVKSRSVKPVPVIPRIFKPRAVKFDSGCRFVMGTVARIICVAKDPNTAERCVDAAFEQLEKVDSLMSSYKDDSEISRINRQAYGNAVKVEGLVFEVLERSVEFGRLSSGAFDVTVGPLVELWRLAEKADKVPNKALLKKDKDRVGYENLILDVNDKSVRFAVKGMKVDLGGIAKGFGIDKALEAMKSCGARGGMVDVGGDIRCFGRPVDRKYWLIGLQDPAQAKDGFESGEPLLVLKAKDMAIATSGDYRRSFTIDGGKYHHIIDRNSGRGVQGLPSVTIIAGDATKADALATAVSVMGAGKGLKLVESLKDVEAILILSGPEQRIMQTKGAKKFIHIPAKKSVSKKNRGDRKKIRSGKRARKKTGEEQEMRYEVLRAKQQPKLAGNWKGPIWGGVEAIELNNYMGDEPVYRPKTEAKLLYDDEFIYVIFRVVDEYVRAIATGFHGKVFEDSCVEFFFAPAEDTVRGYFNVETNCGGAMLFHFQKIPRVDFVPVAEDDCMRVEIYHSEAEIVKPEKQEPTVWFIEYRLPIDILEKFREVEKPAPGVVWRANFYKCGDKTSHPHWLTWSKIYLPEPDFHQPAFFGELVFK